MLSQRFHYVLLAAAAILLIIAFGHQSDTVRETVGQAWKAGSGASSGTFHEIALKHGTDKVTTHQYWWMYDRHFPAIRNKKIKMLEIGLGCDMVSSPSASSPLAETQTS